MLNLLHPGIVEDAVLVVGWETVTDDLNRSLVGCVVVPLTVTLCWRVVLLLNML